MIVQFKKDSVCEIEFKDEDLVVSYGLRTCEKRNIRVFNKAFQRDNLRWKEGAANPILIIGQDKIDKHDELEFLKGQITETNDKLKILDGELKAFEKEKNQILQKKKSGNKKFT